MSNSTTEKKNYFERRAEYRMAAKKAVAKVVVRGIHEEGKKVDPILQEGDSILLDAGTSMFPIADEIVAMAAEHPEQSHYTIMTHNYPAFEILREKASSQAMLNIVLAGGRYDRDLYAMFGHQTKKAYDDFFPRVALIAVSSMIADRGLFCHGNTEELEVKSLLFKKEARDRVIVVDYSKLGVPDALRFGDPDGYLANVQHCFLVTDKPPITEDREVRNRYAQEVERLRSKNVEVIEIEMPENPAPAEKRNSDDAPRTTVRSRSRKPAAHPMAKS